MYGGHVRINSADGSFSGRICWSSRSRLIDRVPLSVHPSCPHPRKRPSSLLESPAVLRRSRRVCCGSDPKPPCAPSTASPTGSVTCLFALPQVRSDSLLSPASQLPTNTTYGTLTRPGSPHGSQSRRHAGSAAVRRAAPLRPPPHRPTPPTPSRPR